MNQKYIILLNQSLSKPTVLSLSRVILENRDDYYRAFKTVENPLNKGELTFFVIALLELVRQAQLEVITRLEMAFEKQSELYGLMNEIEGSYLLKKKEREVVFMLMQYETFGLFGDASVEEIADHLGVGAQAARNHLRALEDKDVVIKVRPRGPMTFALSERFREEVGVKPLVWRAVQG